MLSEFYPHQIFQSDFNQIITEAKRQEKVHLVNKGELDVAKRIFDFISNEVGPRIEDNEWVFSGAHQFANEFAPQYFNRLRLTGEQTVKYQNQLHATNEEVTQLLAEFRVRGKAPRAGNIDLKKASDFIDLISYDDLAEHERIRVDDLHQRVKQHEILQLNLTLDAISDLYEMGLPRVMFVFRRALKMNLGKKPSSSDDDLNPPSNYIDWINGNMKQGHVLIDYFASENTRTFYRTSRNVSSHHRALLFNQETNLVTLVDDRVTLDIPLYEFQQRYRYLTYLVYYGMRGILYHFSIRERGEVSLRVCEDYENTFPSQMPGIVERRVKPY
jgi:hypothetical protein